ncbi:MAG: hypothetical protein ACI9EF_002270 [Pseudohongiellaceae bacterium]|jgi:hypothetical protein
MAVSEPRSFPSPLVTPPHSDRPLIVSASRAVASLDAKALSEAVALEVMGWRQDGDSWQRPAQRESRAWEPTAKPIFASSPREASNAVNQALADGWHCTIHFQPSTKIHAVSLWRRPHDRVSSEGESMPLAACRAILELARSRWHSRPLTPA